MSYYLPPALRTAVSLCALFLLYGSLSGRVVQGEPIEQKNSAGQQTTGSQGKPNGDDTKQEKLPPARKTYKGRTIAQTMHYLGAPWLVRKSREKEEACSKLLKWMDIQQGQSVCDLGCGNGYYTLKLARLVGSKGKVFAVDIQPEMLTKLNLRAKQQEIDNVQPILGSLIDPNLAKGSVDLILLVDVYHEFSHPEQMLQAMYKSLKPSGRVVLVEYREEDPLVPIKPLHKMSKQQIMKEYVPNGFKLVDQYDKLPWQHVMVFARKDSPLKEVKVTESP